MGKDRSGKYHPPKGRPSDDSREELGLRPTMDPDALEQDLEMTDKYTKDANTLADNVHLLHPNRNPRKGREKQPDRQDGTIRETESSTPETTKHSAVELPYALDKTTLVSLARLDAKYCVSIYMPVHSGGMAVNEMSDAIAFKNMLQQMQHDLKQQGASQSMIENILQPGFALQKDNVFWRTQQQGLAVFMAENCCRYIKLPATVKPEMIVNHEFLLTPMLPFLVSEQHFFLLSISKHRAKLFRGDRFGVVPIPLPDMPLDIDDVVHFEEKQENGVFRTGGGSATGGANFHGIGGGQPDEKQNIALYFAEVDRTIIKGVLANETAPLLLAGVAYLHPIYIGVSHYKYIAQVGLMGNYENVGIHELHRQGYEKISPLLDEQVQKWLDVWQNEKGGKLASEDPADIISASFFGKTGRLFIAQDTHIWGHFDPENNTVTIHNEREDDDDCLVNQAAIQTLMHGGFVHILPTEKMPSAKSPMAALYRFP